jgi:GTPase SAR1 family protein
MKIFILGFSGVGKTTFAKQLCSEFNFHYISASKWVRDEFSNENDRNKLTKFALNKLKEDPYFSCSLLSDKIFNLNIILHNIIVDSIRNPLDFVINFDHFEDKIIWLNNYSNKIQPTFFEQSGLKVIQEYINFNIDNGILDRNKLLELNFDTFKSLEDKWKDSSFYLELKNENK